MEHVLHAGTIDTRSYGLFDGFAVSHRWGTDRAHVQFKVASKIQGGAFFFRNFLHLLYAPLAFLHRPYLIYEDYPSEYVFRLNNIAI